MSASLLAFDRVSFHYPSNHCQVLAGFDLAIPQGRVTAVLGPNGAGKTTLLHLGMGWLKPDEGQVLLDGRPLGTFSRRELGRWIGLVPQDEHITFEYSLLEYVLLGRAPYLHPLAMPGPADCRQALWALERVGLAERAHRPVLKLSGGERQLVLLARSLAQQPRLILMDEPTAHLDLGNKKRLLEIIQMLKREGICVLLTTHEPDFAAAAASDLVLVAAGGLLATGSVDAIFTSANISRLYDVPVEVVSVDGQRLVSWMVNP